MPGEAYPDAVTATRTLVWARVSNHVEDLLSKPHLLDDDRIRLAHMRFFLVNVGREVEHGDPVNRDDLERLAASAIHWALDLPEPDLEDQP